MNTLLAQGFVFFKDSKKTVIFSSLIVFTLVLEEIFENVVFQCPCENHLNYGLLFLIGPSFILFVAGIVLNPNTWWLCNIKRIKHEPQGIDQNCLCRKSKRLFFHAVGLVVDIFFKALISPTLWLILSFLQKTFFVCAAFGPRLENRNLENNAKNLTSCGNLKPRSLSEQTQLMAKSQTIGLALLMISTTLIILCAFVWNRLGYKSRMSLPNEKFYRRVETIEAVKEFNERAKQEAQMQGKKAVEEAFHELANDYRDNYLLRIAKVAEKLDQKYSLYYNSSAQIIEEKQRRSDEGSKKGNGYVAHCRFEEDLNRHTFFVVDGKIDTSKCEAKIQATIESADKDARTRTKSGITSRVSLYRRAKSVR